MKGQAEIDLPGMKNLELRAEAWLCRDGHLNQNQASSPAIFLMQTKKFKDGFGDPLRRSGHRYGFDDFILVSVYTTPSATLHD